MTRATVVSLAVAVPPGIRTNADIRDAVPDAVASATEGALARAFRPMAGHMPGVEEQLFDAEMAPYAADPFAGSVERRVLRDGESPADLEHVAAQRALAAAGLEGPDIDLLVCVSAPPERIWPGTAAGLAARLGITGTALNLESWNSGSLVALALVDAVLRARRYRRALVVTSATYSRMGALDNSLSWFVGDAAAGLVLVGGAAAGAHVVTSEVQANPDGCDAFEVRPFARQDGSTGLHLRATPRVRQLLVPSSIRGLGATARAAIDQAGLETADIDVLVGYSSTAWLASVCARALGIDPGRTVDLHASFANVGPVIPLLGLHDAARRGRLRPGQHVLLVAMGPDCGTASMIVRWGAVALHQALDAPLGCEPG